MTDKLRCISIHESGHAVIADLLCMNPEYITIEPTEAFQGHLRRRGTDYTALEKWRNLLVLCAGHVAEGLGLEDMDLDFYPYDALNWVYRDEETTDSALLWTSLQEHNEDEDQRQAWFELAFAQTQGILSNRAVWRSVESLAARLMEKRTLDCVESAEVIQVALGRSKWKREQFQMGLRYAVPPQTWIDSREEYRAIEISLAAKKGSRSK